MQNVRYLLNFSLEYMYWGGRHNLRFRQFCFLYQTVQPDPLPNSLEGSPMYSGTVRLGPRSAMELQLRATSHLTISMRGQRTTGKIQRNNYHYGNCGLSLGYFSLDDF